MGGKGWRRREKNYRAAHRGQIGLPPPPDPSALDAVPAKLRKIMSFTGLEGGKGSSNGADKSRRDRNGVTEKRLHLEDRVGSKTIRVGKDGEDGNLTTNYPDHDKEDVDSSIHEKKKKKRKRGHVTDLRFEQLDELGGIGSKRKERKKQRLEEKKKKRKRIREGENVGFQARDEVKFGEVVEAPPKLVAVPKAFKTTQDVSRERLRLQAVEAYRKRKGWTSRPGVQLPLTVTGSQGLQL